MINESDILKASILIVDDQQADVSLLEHAVRGAGFTSIASTMNPHEVCALHRKNRYDLILLDLNLPKMDGREVLSKIKEDESLKVIPVVVLTSSKDEADVLKAYGLHANCYIVKPVDFEKFAEVVKTIESFWFAVVTLPGGE